MNPKKFPMPTGMLLKTDDEEKFLPFQNPTTYKDITVELKPNGEALRVYVTADTTPVQRVTLYFADPLPEKAQVLGGVWERGYGDYEWRGYVPHRVMPWYFFLQSGNKTEAFGVHTQPAAMCWWTAESTGYSVYLDVRCGGLGVRLNGRTLCAAELCRAEYEDTDGFTAMGEFFSVLSPNPILPKSPVYGANNWYHAYGHATEDDVLREAKALAELTEGLANRPWFIIDDCWQIDRADNYNGGPWRAGNKGFPDMPGLAKKLRESGIQPGIWVRLLWDHSESIPVSWRSKRDPEYLDPSVPEVLDHIAEDIRTVSSWGYKLIKHDFTSYDVLGRWGFEMGDELTDSGWRFADETRTTAEILIELYKRILAAAGDAMVMGCNCFGHLGAGLMHLNRTGDDVSGKLWARTRRMGMNTLAFTAPMHDRFFAIDADCVPLTDAIDETLGMRWLELVAKSGTPTLLSVPASYLNGERKAIIRDAFRRASQPQPTARPLDWHETTCPAVWKLGEETKHFDWTEPCGILTGSV